MKSKLLIVDISRQFVCTLVLAIVLFVPFNIAAQTPLNSVVRPKAILLAELNGLSVIIPPVSTSQSIKRARVVNLEYLKNAETKTDSVSRQAPDKKNGGRVASLKPTLLEEQAFALVNEQRSLQKLQLLELDLEMLYLARRHSENMARLNFFGHCGRDGKTVAERSFEIGVTDWQAIGENLAFNQGVEKAVEFSVQSWLNSDSHKRNLLGTNWIRSGIGIFQTSDGRFYITQVFRN